jgi:paraquat-inducible protein A
MRAIERGLTNCPVCHAIVKVPMQGSEEAAYCPRCDSEVYIRKPDAIQKTWAFLLASIVFYIPANILPMMHVITFAGTESDTIMSGVLYFLDTGAYLIAFVIFTASIFVPILKILILIYLLISVQKGSCLHRMRRKKLYILTEIIGRWSMVDVYVVGTMIALVHFGALTEITPGMGANFFLLVVIMTMLSAMSFDPKLIWDNTKECNAKQ